MSRNDSHVVIFHLEINSTPKIKAKGAFLPLSTMSMYIWSGFNLVYLKITRFVENSK